MLRFIFKPKLSRAYVKSLVCTFFRPRNHSTTTGTTRFEPNGRIEEREIEERQIEERERDVGTMTQIEGVKIWF